MRDGRQYELHRSAASRHLRHRCPKNCDQPADLAGAAARQDQNDRRVGAPAPRFVSIGTQLRKTLDQRVADIDAGRAAEAGMDRGLER